MMHEEDLEEQVGPPVEVGRDEPATEEHEPAPTPEPEPAPRIEEQEMADISDLTNQEEQKIEQLHNEHKPHVHKGLPYEEKEDVDFGGWEGQRVSSLVGEK